VHVRVELEPLALGRVDRVGYYDERGWKDLEVVWVAARSDGAPLDVGVQLLGRGEVARRAKHCLGRLGRQLMLRVRLAGLGDDGPGNVERAVDMEALVLVV